jgi:hypothetical protein
MLTSNPAQIRPVERLEGSAGCAPPEPIPLLLPLPPERGCKPPHRALSDAWHQAYAGPWQRHCAYYLNAELRSGAPRSEGGAPGRLAHGVTVPMGVVGILSPSVDPVDILRAPSGVVLGASR